MYTTVTEALGHTGSLTKTGVFTQTQILKEKENRRSDDHMKVNSTQIIKTSVASNIWSTDATSDAAAAVDKT